MTQWNLSVRLTCGHEIDLGTVDHFDDTRLLPRRKDGLLGAMRCPEGHGRRRVLFASTRIVKP